MKKETGVTLVALIVTIIVLLILAGITISLTIGQDGMIARAQQAGKNYLNAAEYENIQLAEFTNMMDNIIGNTTVEKNIYNESVFRTSVIKAITEAGVETADDATDETIIENIGKILEEGTKEDIEIELKGTFQCKNPSGNSNVQTIYLPIANAYIKYGTVTITGTANTPTPKVYLVDYKGTQLSQISTGTVTLSQQSEGVTGIKVTNGTAASIANFSYSFIVVIPNQ